MKKILIVFGTRPEIIKLAPLAEACSADKAVSVRTCLFRQHGSMARQALNAFRLVPDYDLPISLSDRVLFGKGISIFSRIRAVGGSGIGLLRFLILLKQWKPEVIVVQGDTSTAFLAAFLAFHFKIAIAHVEAGLRTYTKYSPFPEEMNRKLLTALADVHFAPTEGARDNLLRENVPMDRIHIVGNTAIDALRRITEREEDTRDAWEKRCVEKYDIRFDGPFILVTAHRRENFGEGLAHICDAVRRIAQEKPAVQIIVPVHHNPNVRGYIQTALGGIQNTILTEPLEYEAFVFLMRRTLLILTDSGGIQEETAFLGVPTLIMRESTERAEAVIGGTAKLVGTNTETIVRETLLLLNDTEARARMGRPHTAFGDGHAAEKIVRVLSAFQNQ